MKLFGSYNNRDTALSEAGKAARTNYCIVIVYEASSGEWKVTKYGAHGHQGPMHEIRYVLPNGEITKLS